MSRIFVTSDFHFCHLNLILYCNRSWNVFEELIENHNKVVKKDDLVIHIGDYAFKADGNMLFLKECSNQLNGYKVLIKGNHDNFKNDFYLNDLGFKKLYNDYMIINKTLLCHYPLREPTEYDSKKIIRKMEKLLNVYTKNNLEYIVHGHIHDPKYPELNYHYNVAVDRNNYTPILLKDAIKKIETD